MNLGRALVLSGDIEAGLESNQKALAICAALFADNPSNADYRRLLAISYQNDGDYRAILHDTSGALESFRKKLALDEQSFADDPRQCAVAREDLGYTAKESATCWRSRVSTRRRARTTAERWTLYERLSADSPQDVYIRYRVDHRPRRNRRDAGEARRADRRAGRVLEGDRSAGGDGREPGEQPAKQP